MNKFSNSPSEKSSREIVLGDSPRCTCISNHIFERILLITEPEPEPESRL